MKKARKNQAKKKPKLINKNIRINTQLEQFMTVDLNSLTTTQLIEEANILNKAVDDAQPEQVLEQRTRIAEMVEIWMKKTQQVPEWAATLHAKQLIGSALACDALATANKGDDDTAAGYWLKGSLLFSQVLSLYPNQPEWVANYHQKHLLEGGAAFDRVAQASKGTDDLKTADYWVKGSALLGEYVKLYPNAPEWLAPMYTKQLLEGGMIYDRLADAAKNSDDDRAADYWVNGALLLGRLVAQYPDQPEWVARLFEKQFLEGGVAGDRAASANKGTDDAKAADNWLKGAALLWQYLKMTADAPEWVINSHKKQLLEGGLACDRVAVASKGVDDVKAADYWTKGALLLGRYLKLYGNDQEWVLNAHAKQLLEGSVACHRVATDKKAQNDAAAADFWAQAAVLFGQLLADYPEQPEWVVTHRDIAKNNASATPYLAQLIDLDAFDKAFCVKKK
ncbi:hypothetical protein [Methylovulum psychrotolerans]|jgi:hypothetical protein|uniref:Uncharacterized protein n=1 Tax=Methylovulum psychrotolerans TaxID=1704499 RepID=A0A2S5CP76_9GAMM|nr:hypothetical protein [Methylovulum psychrotolerans]POZ52588.1 hypothetical protein AADEFJLK_01190 [Methylovulum psychrotolerans]